MKTWQIKYELCDNFSTSIKWLTFVLRCFPYRCSCISADGLDCSIIPNPVSSWGTDSFGNTILKGRFMQECIMFQAKIRFCVHSSYAEGSTESRPPYMLGIYRSFSPMTRPGKKILGFARGFSPDPAASPVLQAEALMQRLYGNFSYVKGSTDCKSTAEQALQQGCGVCQDYAHIFLSLCRCFKICARYVAGAIPGEGESHAWAEVYEAGRWTGLDPTHNCRCDDSYVPFATGRDSLDCSLNRGNFRGPARQKQYVGLIMSESAN